MIKTLSEISAEWLNDFLKPALDNARIASFTSQSNAAFNSHVAHLTLQYEGTESSIPSRLLVKLNHEGDGAAEIDFYNTLGMLDAHLPMIVPCYAASITPEGDSCLVLQDLSGTHGAPVTRDALLTGHGVPTAEQMAGIVDALAGLHAFWWDHPRLGDGMAAVRHWYRDQAHFEKHVLRRQTEWHRFNAAVGESLPDRTCQILEHTLARMPNLWEACLRDRVEPLHHLTVTHGDCYLTQFLCPSPSTRGQTYLIDFQDASANFGAYDLVYLMAAFWTSEQRTAHQRELHLLRRYWDGLIAGGVEQYSYDELLVDYRLMIAHMIFDPVWNQTAGASENYWRPKLQCLIDAYEDWDCQALVDSA